jgi:Gram-negative bacterial TonB protein C-terminal
MIMHPLRSYAAVFLTIVSVAVCHSQTAKNWPGYPESYAREVAITTALPVYPTDAVQRKITAVVQAKIAINDQGQVAIVKIHPAINAAFKQAVADAVSQWTFKIRPEIFTGGVHCLSRLTFRFSIVNGEPRVELYTPERGVKDTGHLGYWNGYKELREWNIWEEVEPTKIQPQP